MANRGIRRVNAVNSLRTPKERHNLVPLRPLLKVVA